jgi:hypothetical protein
MTVMKRFLAIYLGSAETAASKQWLSMPDAERAKRERSGIEAWMGWGERHEASIVERGTPLGKTKRIDKSGLSDTRNAVCGYVVVEAESHEAAARLFLDHPHFSVFPGEAVEIMECLPLPKAVTEQSRGAATPRGARPRNAAKRSVPT